MMKVAGATTSGLNRPKTPSIPIPTFPRPEKPATWLLESVLGSQGWLVTHPNTGSQTLVSLVIFRNCSTPPTVITFLAVPGDSTVSGKPPLPPSLPVGGPVLLALPEFPEGKT